MWYTEKQMLIEGTEAGNRDSVEHARRLAAKYPEAVQNAKTPGKRQASLEKLEAIGLPALPALRKALRTMKPNHPACAQLQALARRTGFETKPRNQARRCFTC